MARFPVFALVCVAVSYELAMGAMQDQAASFLTMYNSTAEQQYYLNTLAAWNYYTNTTTYNAQQSAIADAKFSAWSQQESANASTFDLSQINDASMKRRLQKISTVGIKLNSNDTLTLSGYVNNMTTIYNTNPICSWQNGTQNCSVSWPLDPNLMNRMANSNDWDELNYIWNAWRNNTKSIKSTYKKFIPLSNKGAQQGGFKDTGAWWRSWYELPDQQFKDQLQSLYYQILPLYEKLHRYVRYSLKSFPPYGRRFTGKAIPAHILGNMWAQEWQNVYQMTKLYFHTPPIDVTQEMKNQNYNATAMFHLADNFFGSLGLIRMPPAFWNGSIITKPTDRPFVCHASAWDFYNRKDFRIKMCTTVNMEELITIHHEMGHIEYYLNYDVQPVSFRSGANPGFHEAIGDTMALSVSTPAHLSTIGLLKNYKPNKKTDINYLYKQALEKIAFLPFGYMIDHWRWGVFDGSITPAQYNTAWWNMRFKYQGIVPPPDSMPRPSDSFDPAAKSHIDDNTPYIRYFVSFIVQFQFYKSLCTAANHTGPLYKCDFYNSKAAGAKLSQMLQMGASEPWPQAMQVLTGQSKMDASAVREYFAPLEAVLDGTFDADTKDHCYGWGYPWPADVMATLPTPRCTTATSNYLNLYNTQASAAYYKDTVASWNYNVDITAANAQNAAAADAQLATFELQQAPIAQAFLQNDSTLQLPGAYNSKRQLTKISTLRIKLTPNQTLDLSKTVNYMAGVYSNAKVCSLDPGGYVVDCQKKWDLPTNLSNIMATSKDYKTLSYAWKAWRDAVGPKIKSSYSHMVKLSNNGSLAGGFNDTGAAWRDVYEDPNFQTEVQGLWNQILPLYEQLHTYVRSQLRKQYPGKWSTNAIPAHILGNMWAQSWVNLFSSTAPNKNVASIDVTNQMIAQNYTPKMMFQKADDFFNSLEMYRVPPNFWNNSMIVQPTDGRKVVCHASAWDFYNAKDVRIKMCTHVDMNDLVTIHHEMGHIQYYMQYKKQPVVFRGGANPGFHEAIGDTMALSVNTPGHMKAIGLLPNYSPNNAQNINFLYRQALSKIAFLPFGYIMDLWRWKVFSGQSQYSNWNTDWWKLRLQYQGVEPPVPRGGSDFDPGAKFHIPSNVPYIRYFVSYVVQFQFYQSMCNAKNYTGDLYLCDFYNSKQAGNKLAQMMKLGSSVQWSQALYQATGSYKMSASALMNYFQPLINWLKQQNQGECFGWGQPWPGVNNLPTPRCGYKQATPNQQAQTWLGNYNQQAAKVYNKQIVTAWAWETNITDYNQKQQDYYATQRVIFDQNETIIAQKFPLTLITDPPTKRQMGMIGTIGLKLSPAETAQFNTLVSNMTGTFSKAYICNPAYPNCTQLPASNTVARWYRDPTLTTMMANQSTSYDMLNYIWTGWRNATGRKVLNEYKTYVNLGNKGAKAAGFIDMGDYWRSVYEDPTFKVDLENLWRQILPLYEQLHTYARRSLMKKYAGRFSTSAIPAHILGNMWAQEWNNLYSVTTPFSGVPSVDVTMNMQKQGYNATKMFRTAETFYKSIGMYPMNPSFWNISMITKPKGRDVDCYASAEDFYNGKDFGIKMCTKVTMEDLITIHHEMGHVEYFMAYAQQPIKFRNGANPGFHEAIGDTMALSVSTPSHLNKIGLLPNNQYDPNNTKQDINFLYKTALSKIAFLPFGYLIDNYRWKVFDGSIHSDQLNQGWWDLRYKYQGIVPPVTRTNMDFDAGSKFHVADNVPYIRYFVSFVVQFQFHKALCNAAGQGNVPLHKCDIYNSKAAGTLLKNTLTLGASKPWPVAMLQMTNQTKMDAGPLLEYFAPLITWLNQTNTMNNECFGWGYVWPSSYKLQNPRCTNNIKHTASSSSAPNQSTTTAKVNIAPSTTVKPNPTTTAAAKSDRIANSFMMGLVLLTLVFVRH